MESSSSLGDKYITQVSPQEYEGDTSQPIKNMDKVLNPSKIEIVDINNEKLNYTEQTWDIIQSFVRDQQFPFTEHQISSFNDLYKMSNSMIISEADIDSLNNFVFDLSNFSE